MTYQEFRNYGFRSRLSDVLVAKGPDKQIQTAGDITGRSLNISSDASKGYSDSYAKMKELLQPFIGQQTALAAGNRDEALRAAMPVISQLSGGFTGAKQQILNSMPAGAARDRALADLSTQTDGTIAGAQANAVQQAPQNLSTIGQFLGGYGLQQLGASMAGLQGATTSNNAAMQAEVEKQRSLLNFFSSLAGVGTSLIPGLGSLFAAKPNPGTTSAGMAAGFNPVSWSAKAS